MHVLQLAPYSPVTGGNVLLFDIGVKGVEENTDIRMTNFLREPGSIGGRVQKIGFKSVDRFNGKRYVVGSQRITEGLKSLNRPPPLIAGAPPARQVAHRAVEGPGHN